MTKVQHQEPIAVIGMACRFPGGSDSPSKLWELLKSPRDLSKRVPTDRFDSTGFFHPDGSHHGATDCQNAYFLEEDVTRFDNGFFNIQPGEAEALDPQQRLLLETVYESLCTAGQTVEALRGSKTAICVGLMCDDWAQMAGRDWDLVPTYTATGTSRAVHSNRISYYFDWHGPSMTIDTACSSSLVAVHQCVTALRNGECPIAVAAGANLILAPGMWIAESKLHMLSPTGTSKMWDTAADGYARGEGIAAVVLKPLSAALRDNDNIDCIIRETGVNQDGRTAGLTMPSNLAQSELIRDTYKRAGLDINNPSDRPQFFHAHGTGTPAGDPQEAEAISKAFFETEKVNEPLYVGSIKTVIGHTEGTAGLASLIGTSLAMKNGLVPPNLHFNTLSDSVAPFCAHLRVPTRALPWPVPVDGQPRRASINSFGFGGTNAHAIIEGYEPVATEKASSESFTPLTVSAASPSALRIMLSDLQTYLVNQPDANMRDLAHTLQAHRSTFAFRKSIASRTTNDAVNNIESLLADTSGENGLSSRYPDVFKPRIMGVFTGQGAQWPKMGAWLIEKSPFVTKRLNQLDEALANLPISDRPDWKFADHLLAEPSVSELSKAAVSQPICTAVQIVLVDLIRAADIELHAVVGHSSGEIGASYAAGFLSAQDAIRVAYYRGLSAKLSRSPACQNIKGAMMAVGTSYEDALEFCQLDDFEGRIQVAAHNSPTSATLSGDEDAIDDAISIFKDEGKFARKLQVDTAYHSHHMQACAQWYKDALERSKIIAAGGNDTIWFSSVVEGQIMTKDLVQDVQYWVDNMTGAVLFAPSITAAVREAGPFDMAIELGPHPALKGPYLDTIEELTGKKIPYTGLLRRQKNDVEELSSALGYIWTHFGSGCVNFDGFEKITSGVICPRQMITNLPSYPFDHSRSFYTLTRFSGSHQNMRAPLHPLLGRRVVETETEDHVSWRNVLRSTEISWLQGHALQGQAVFPAMGYIAMAVEATASLAGSDKRLGLISLENVVISRAMAFSDDSTGMETRVALNITRFTDEELTGHVTCHSGLPYDNSAALTLNFSSAVQVLFHEPEAETLPAIRVNEINLANADPKRFYSQFDKLGYNYSFPFTGVKSVHRKKGFATGEIEDISGDNWEDHLIIHPGLLDSALQTAFAAYCHPHDERFSSLHVPTAIQSVVINPYFTDRGAGRYRKFEYQSISRDKLETPLLSDIELFAGQGQSNAFVQFESLQVQPFAGPTSQDDVTVFSSFAYKLAEPNATVAVENEDYLNRPESVAIFQTIERVGFFYLRRIYETITAAEAATALPHYKLLIEFTSRVVPRVAQGNHPTVPKEAMADSLTYIRSLISKYHHRSDIQLLEVVGENIVEEIRRNGSMIEHMLKDGVLDRFYEEGFDLANVWISRIIAQIAHRHPRMHVFEVGAGTGGSTRSILPTLGDAFSTYTFTDLSAGFFERANDRFIEYADRMIYGTFNMEIPPADQGYEEGTYDLVLAANVLHATGKMEDTLANTRRLLRPGGYLILLEIMGNDYLGIGATMGGLPGWWAGAAVDPARCDGPCFTLNQWDTLLRRHGFNGVETHTPLDQKSQWYAVLVCQAVDDRVNSLRDPLGASGPAFSKNELVIVGGCTPAGAQLAKQSFENLHPYYTSITHIETLEEFNRSALTTGSSVLSLTEIDQQFLEVRTEAKLNALKALWRNGRTILWVTRGARNVSPYSSSMVGLTRVVRFEYPHLNLQILDFDATPEPKIISESLLRLELGKLWENEAANILWTAEPELHYVRGELFIPRLYPHLNANTRYNTYRRTVHKNVNPLETTIVLESTAGCMPVKPCSPSPLRLLTASKRRTKKRVTLQVEHSLLQSIKIHGAGFFNLFAGTTAETGESLVGLVDTPVESSICVPVEWTVKTPEIMNKASILVSAATNILVQSIIAATPPLGSLIIHGADDILRDAIDKEAGREDIKVFFTAEIKTQKLDDSSLFVHRKTPTRLLRRSLPQDVSLFVNMGSKSVVAELIGKCLSENTIKASLTDFVRIQPWALSSTDIEVASQVLKTASKAATKIRRPKGSEQASSIPLSHVHLHNPLEGPLRVVDWNTGSVEVTLRPIDHGTIFRSDGTYFLVGLSGELGQSLCSFMVEHGARHVVLSSRRPQVSPQYIEGLAERGATVKVMAADVARRASLRECYDTICAEMPPIIGVANGAMILEDVMFDDLQFESQERAMPPKVEGSLYLDELFYDTPLDFFILFTSLAHVGGNDRQSTYVMANLFMHALAAQRRDVRGVVGSDMALGSVTGMGFFEHSSLDKDHFSRLGYRNMSEQDFHRQFAEAILAGRPGEKGSSEIVFGLQPFHDTPNIQAQLRLDPRFKHFLLHDRDSSTQRQGGGNVSAAKPRVRLSTVKTRVEAYAVVKESFTERLKRILLMGATENIDPMVSLVELGADSIMALDVRSWFIKELDVDMPVLKILGPGETVAAMIEEAINKLPVHILDVSKLPEGEESAPIAIIPAKMEELGHFQDIVAPRSGDSSSMTETDSMSASHLASEINLQTPIETETDIFSQATGKLQMHEEQTGQKKKTWRQSIIESSTEHTEQMTFGQNRFWFLSHYVDDPTTFNIAYLGKLQGRVQVENLAEAVESVAQRHESLRTRFFWSEGDTKTPMQGILSKGLIQLETATIDSPAEALQELHAMRDYVWDLSDWVPLRIRLLSLSETEHFILIGTHHISMDGHSFSVLMLDIQQAYHSTGLRVAPLPDTSQARAFGAQQRIAYDTGKLKPSIEHFRSILPATDIVRPIELFSFARTQVRPALDHYGTHVAKIHLPGHVTAKIKQLARGHRATAFHGYLAALQALCFRLLPAETTDKAFIGVADANRLDSKFMASVGNFLNVLPLRFDRVDKQTFGQAVEMARDKAFAGLKHSALPFDLLLDELQVPRSNAWAPVFQVFMDYRLVVKEHANKDWIGCKISEENWHTSSSGYDVALEIMEGHDGAVLAMHVQRALYDASGAELLVNSYVNILKQIAAKGDKQLVQNLAKWDKETVNKGLAIGNGPTLKLEWPETVAHRIDQVIKEYPDSVALKDGYGRVLTYQDMDRRVECISHALLSRLPKNNRQSVVGVFQTPSTDWMCSLLAVHRVGAIYLPLDLRNGAPRLKMNVEAAKPAVLLSDYTTTEYVGSICNDEEVAIIDITNLHASSSLNKTENGATADGSAYIIFTSGSTGEPKGIVVKHAGLRINLEGYHREWAIDTMAEVVLQQTALSFDASLLQIFAALTTGGCLFVVPADARGDPAEVTRLMVEHGVTFTQATPSEYDMWFRFSAETLHQCKTWRAAWFGGERAGLSVLDGFRKACKAIPSLRVFTSYGPTESTISAMKGEADVRNPDLRVPVPGRLLPNYCAYIVDDSMQLVPNGVPGEIIIGGAGVGNNEYLNQMEMTAKQFPSDTFTTRNDNGWGRMYRTGDYGRFNARGYLTVEGRIAGDTQVKLRGFRIELAEIERVMVKEAHGTISDAVVTLRGEGEQDGFLAAHVVLEGKIQRENQIAEAVDRLRARLPLSLPQYMCPAVIVPVENLPLTSHHKVDRKAIQILPLPKVVASVDEQWQTLTDTERCLAKLWNDILPPRTTSMLLGSRSDFFRCGGNSLLLVRLQIAIKSEFGDAPRLSKLMSATELGSMAAVLDDGVSKVNWDKEIALDDVDRVLWSSKSTERSKNICVLVTGATGSLGRLVTQRLVNDESVSRVVCLVRPTEGRDMDKLFPGFDKKIQILSTELPTLPDDKDMPNIDIALHCAADRNFWDSYQAIKPTNVDTVKGLARLCLRRGAILHVLSSGAISAYEPDGGEDCLVPLPRPSPDDGYISSKWVAERYLAQVARETGLPVVIHRPTNTKNNDIEVEKMTSTETDMARTMLSLSSKLGVRPDFTNLGGVIDLTQIEGVVDLLVQSLSEKSSGEGFGMRIIAHPGTARMRINTLAACVDELFGHVENSRLQELPSVSALHWVGLAKRAGLFKWLLTAQNLIVEDEEGNRIVSRR